MSKFLAVYNMKSNNFFAPIIPTLKDFLASDDFVAVGDFIEADSVESVYRTLNIDIPEDITAFVHKIAEADPCHTVYPSLHSSMSCGDVLVEYNVGKEPVYHMCDSCGWVVLV